MCMPCMLSATHGGIYRSIIGKITDTHMDSLNDRYSMTSEEGTDLGMDGAREREEGGSE